MKHHADLQTVINDYNNLHEQSVYLTGPTNEHAVIYCSNLQSNMQRVVH